MRDRRLILGIVRKVVRSRSIAQLQPLFEAAADLSSWSREYSHEEVIEEFPNRGLVSWLGARQSLDEGSLWQFRIEDQQFEDDNPQHDAFRVAQGASIAREVLDLRRYGTADDIRRLVTDGGVAMNFVPSESVYLWVEDDHWVGPVHLQRRDGSRWHLPAWQETQPLAPLPLHKATTEISQLTIGSARIFLTPGAEPGAKLGSVDWSADAMVVKRVLTRVRKQDPKYSEVLQLTQKAIEQAGQMVAGSDHYLQEQQSHRAAAVVESLETNAEQTKEFLAELLALPSVAASIEQARQEAVRNAKTAFDAEMTGERDRLKGLQIEIEGLQKVLRGLDEEQANRRQAMAAQVDALGTEMQEQLQAILEKPTKLLAEVGILRAALGSEKRVEKSQANAVQAAALPSAIRFGKPPKPFENWKMGPEVRETKQVRLALGATARSFGVELPVIQSLHAAFVSGSVPVLYGADSYTVIRAYASSVASGRLLWLPVSVGLLEAPDLFGRSEPQAGRFVPKPGGLADLMREASKLPGFVIVVLDGLNRSAVDAYLSPIIACYEDSQRGGTVRCLSISHPSLLAEDDPYACIATLTWPANVLLAGVLGKDVTTIPPSPEFWVHSRFVSADGAAAETELTGSRPSATPSSFANGWIGRELWRELRATLAQKESSEFRKGWLALADEDLRLPATLRESCRSFYEGMVSWPTEPKGALQEAIESAVVPYVVAKGEGEKFLEVAGKAVPDREALRKQVELVKEALS
jgi:hypothetical protein